ncbi:aminoacyl-tRNA hydrolase [Haloplasma contractile]|uniref:Peptidyl-tRNA hydrolase n=1 Tax=Haloplasma contractile SSD-17B TaxID=1033810 RepID=U2ECG7_9MOLU|nr:aminoacyl-tRNA hydrolase [Haloplasma contractile]ERJ12461.1 Peptidyl-tRNA hydrolase protein [Haloplasma contractile SSD-17B]
MKIIVGLGNPGKKYKDTRHNVGFMVLDEYTRRNNLVFEHKSKYKAECVQTLINNEKVILLKPLTYMNLSGESVKILKDYYNVDDQDILIIYDDLDLSCGKIRFKQKGSSGGHNGIKSIINCINSKTFHRLKIGIERSEVIPVVNYVLGKFTKEQRPHVLESIEESILGIEDWISKDIAYVMNKYN